MVYGNFHVVKISWLFQPITGAIFWEFLGIMTYIIIMGFVKHKYIHTHTHIFLGIPGSNFSLWLQIFAQISSQWSPGFPPRFQRWRQPRFFVAPTKCGDAISGGWKTILKNMSSSVGMMTFPIYGNIKNVPNHQPDFWLHILTFWINQAGPTYLKIQLFNPIRLKLPTKNSIFLGKL